MRSGMESSTGGHHLSIHKFQVLEHSRFRRFKLGIFASSVAVFTSLQQMAHSLYCAPLLRQDILFLPYTCFLLQEALFALILGALS